jgi:RNA polymerase sigma factor (sigma-70 family)
VALVSQADHATAQAVASRQSVPCSSLGIPGGFGIFYRSSYKEVVKAAMIAGATIEEAEDAASRTFVAMLRKWPVDGVPLAYARKAVVSNFIQDKTRGTARVARRLIERGHAPHQEGAEDAGFSAAESEEWIAGVLSELPPSQREVMERIAGGLTYEEIAEDLGRSREVVRRRLCDARARLVRILNPDGSRARQPPLAAERPPREET